jgi:uncharacterized protein (TIGR02246 family)
MRLVHTVTLCCMLLAASFQGANAGAGDAIRNVLAQQVQAWNQGDLKQFVSSYASHCTLVGNGISETTREQVLAHYEQKYPSSAARGKLTYSDLTLHRIDSRVAIVTGRWRLSRTTDSGGPAGGVFSLVFESINGNWQIVLDHTS